MGVGFPEIFAKRPAKLVLVCVTLGIGLAKCRFDWFWQQPKTCPWKHVAQLDIFGDGARTTLCNHIGVEIRNVPHKVT